jgi:Family of unknown function (DUF6261)
MTIQSIDLKSLRNAEYIQLQRDLLKMIHLNDETLLKCKPQYDATAAMLAVIDAIFKTDQGSDVTPIIEALDAKRDAYIMGIYKNIESYTFHFAPAKVAAANVLTDALKIYGFASDVTENSLPAETATINSMVGDIATKANLVAATTELGLTTWFTELKTTNDLLAQKYIDRTVELGGANPNVIKDKRIEANELFYKLRDMIIAQATVANDAAPFPKTINEINALITQYNVILNNRASDAAKAKPVVIG